jgi:DNA-binding transcriptional ArsR family regulator
MPSRVREVALLRGLGYTFREIARQLDVSPQAVTHTLSRYRRSAKALEGTAELQGLSARARSFLSDLGISCRAEAHGKDVLMLLRGRANCGRKTLDEIAAWLGEECEARVVSPAHSSDKVLYSSADPAFVRSDELGDNLSV